MSLRKSPTRTAAFMEANRRNALKSTGPKTTRGKAWTRLNSLREGWRSSEYIHLIEALLTAPPGEVEATAKSLLRSRQNHHPLFQQVIENHVEAEIDLCVEERLRHLFKSKLAEIENFSTSRAGMLLKTKHGEDEKIGACVDLSDTK